MLPIFELTGDLLSEPRVVVVLNEISKKRSVNTVRFDGIDHVIEVADTAAGRFKSIEQLIVPACHH